MITSFRSEVDTFENEYRIWVQHFGIDTFLSFDTFDNPRINMYYLCYCAVRLNNPHTQAHVHEQ